MTRIYAGWNFRKAQEVERGQEIQEGKARCPGAQEERDEEGDPREEKKETGAKARACSGRPVAAGLGRFRWQDRKSLDHHRRRQRHRADHLCAVQIGARARSRVCRVSRLQR